MIALGTEIPPELVVLLKPGAKLRLFFNEDNPNNAVYHIRAVVDGSMIVFREWSREKQSWRYRIESAHLFYLYWKDGALSKA